MNENRYITRGVCSDEITFRIDKGILKNVTFKSGCEGNLHGIEKLVEGMPVKEVIEKLKGIDCDGKGTSCPDQLARALEDAIKAKAV